MNRVEQNMLTDDVIAGVSDEGNSKNTDHIISCHEELSKKSKCRTENRYLANKKFIIYILEVCPR